MDPGSLMNPPFIPLHIPPSLSYTNVKGLPRSPSLSISCLSIEPARPRFTLRTRTFFQNKAGSPEGRLVSPCHWCPTPPPMLSSRQLMPPPRPHGLAHTAPSTWQTSLPAAPPPTFLASSRAQLRCCSCRKTSGISPAEVRTDGL